MRTETVSTKPPTKKIILGSYVLVISLLLIFPLAVVFLISFDTSSYINFPPKGFSSKWYQALPTNPNFEISVKNSLLVAFSSTLLSVLVAVPSALVITRNKFRGRNLLYVLCLSSLTVPWIVYGVALLFFWTWLDLELSIWTLIFGHTVIGAPYVLRTSVAVLTDMPTSYERSARSLGATRLRTFWSVTLPLMLPGLTAGASFAFIVSVVNIPVSLFVTTADNITIPVAIFNYMQYNFDPGVAAFSIVQLLIIGVFIAFAVRAARTGAV